MSSGVKGKPKEPLQFSPVLSKCLLFKVKDPKVTHKGLGGHKMA